jgi:hypothetical protein
MLQSHIIDIDGLFVGVAVRLDKGFRFIATDPRVEDVGETIWPTLAEVRRISRIALSHGRPVISPHDAAAEILAK